MNTAVVGGTMQFISYLVDPALLQGDLPSKIVSTIIFLVVAVVLLGVGYYVLRLVASFFNPLSSRTGPLLIAMFVSCASLAGLFYFKEDWVLTHIPQAQGLIGASTVMISCALFAVAAAKLLRYAMITCAWGGLCLVLVSFVIFQQSPEVMLKEKLPLIQAAIQKELAESKPMIESGWAERMLM